MVLPPRRAQIGSAQRLNEQITGRAAETIFERSVGGAVNGIISAADAFVPFPTSILPTRRDVFNPYT